MKTGDLVDDLRDAIVKARKQELGHKQFELFQISVSPEQYGEQGTTDVRELFSMLRDNMIDTGYTPLGELFGTSPPPTHIHVLIREF